MQRYQFKKHRFDVDRNCVQMAVYGQRKEESVNGIGDLVSNGMEIHGTMADCARMI